MYSGRKFYSEFFTPISFSCIFVLHKCASAEKKIILSRLLHGKCMHTCIAFMHELLMYLKTNE